MKTTNTEQKHIWQIDDVVYYVDESPVYGKFPSIGKGTVHEIHRDYIRVKTADPVYEYVSVDTRLCYCKLDRLFEDLQAWFLKERKRLEKA